MVAAPHVNGIERRDGTLAERAILAEVLAMRTILLNFMLTVGEGTAIPRDGHEAFSLQCGAFAKQFS